MNETKPVLLIFNYKKTNTYAINVISYGSFDDSVKLEKIEELLASVREIIGKISSSTLHTLKRLGISLYGQWRKQILIAQHLATLKDI